MDGLGSPGACSLLLWLLAMVPAEEVGAGFGGRCGGVGAAATLTAVTPSQLWWALAASRRDGGEAAVLVMSRGLRSVQARAHLCACTRVYV